MLTTMLPVATTSFVGRAEEFAHITTLLDDPQCRLITLMGPGGIGKTRLALQVAAGQAARFAHGVYFVGLTGVSSPELIAPAVASTLQLTPYNASDLRLQLISYLRDKQALLVMDNFEHLLDGAELLTDLLYAAPDVKFLVTSRERLNVQEEWVVALDGLLIPDYDDHDAPEHLDEYPSVQLFVQRARQVQPGFSLAENAEAVRTICQRVEGMPLALELAASWLRAMSCRQIAAQIEQGLDFLTTPLRNVPERHRSLRAVFEHSWNLLPEAERDALMRLAIFACGFDMDAADQVADATLLVLAGLVDKSLIRLRADGRYDIHELLRQYATEKHTKAGVTQDTADRHLRYYVQLVEGAETHLWGREQQDWYNRLETELGNIREALSWSLNGGDPVLGLRLATALGWLFVERSRPSEGLDWLERLLAANPDVPATLRAKALNRAGEIAGLIDNAAQLEAFCTEALDVARSAGDLLNVAWAQSNLGYYLHLKRSIEPFMIAALEESLSLFRQLDDQFGLNHTLRRYAQLLIVRRDYAHARQLLDEALSGAQAVDDLNALAHIHQSIGDIFSLQQHDTYLAEREYRTSLSLFHQVRNRLGIVYALSNLAFLEQTTGSAERARALYQESLRMMREFAPTGNMLQWGLCGLACIETTMGRYERAVILFGASPSIFSPDFDMTDPLRVIIDRCVSELRERLGETAFAEAWAAGLAMMRDEVFAYALQAEDDVVPSPAAGNGHHLPTLVESTPLDALSEREQEILRLVSAGYSNRQIAAELVLALGTVKWYLNTINSKLGVTSRTQAVARARDLGWLPS